MSTSVNKPTLSSVSGALWGIAGLWLVSFILIAVSLIGNNEGVATASAILLSLTSGVLSSALMASVHEKRQGRKMNLGLLFLNGILSAILVCVLLYAFL